jgi:hypothetical protein
MLKGLVSIIVFGIIIIAVIAMVVLYFLYKGFRNARDIQEEFMRSGGKRYSRQEYIRNQQREQREKNPFGKDYFKSSSDTKKKEPKAEKETTTRRTTTDSGVTIIDDRESEEKKKIFDHTDGEYVEFEEVRG